MCRRFQRRLRDVDPGHAAAGPRRSAGAGRAFSGPPCLGEGLGIGVEPVASLHDLDPDRDLGRCGDLDRQPEAIEELRPEFALFGVAAADEDETGRMAKAQAFPLDDILARSRHIEQQVDDMVLEEIDFVDVEKSAVGAGQETRLESGFAGHQGAFEVECTGDAIFRGTERQVDHGNGAPALLQWAGQAGFAAFVAARVAIRRIATVAATIDDDDLRQDGGESPDGGRLARAAVAQHQNAADTRIDRRHRQRQLHLVLADDRTEWKRHTHSWNLEAPAAKRQRPRAALHIDPCGEAKAAPTIRSEVGPQLSHLFSWSRG